MEIWGYRGRAGVQGPGCWGGRGRGRRDDGVWYGEWRGAGGDAGVRGVTGAQAQSRAPGEARALSLRWRG